MKAIDRLISEQVRIWNRNEAKKGVKKESDKVWPVITISREFGAHGRTLAKELGRRTDFKVWDKELLSAISEEGGADELFLASLDEKRRKMIDDTLYGTLIGFKHSNTHYYRSLLRVVSTIGLHGKGIIVGRGSNYILKTPNPLRVRLVSPIEERVSYIAKVEGITEKDAYNLVKSRDAERVDFVKHYFKMDVDNAHDYDLVLNSGVFKIDQLVDLILLAYEKKTGRAIPLIE